MSTKEILQIVLIPIITVLLTMIWDSVSKRRIRKRAKDKETYKSIKEGFEKERDLVSFFKNHSVGDDTLREDIQAVGSVKQILESPGCIFTFKVLENLRIRLYKKIDEFLMLTGKHLHPSKSNNKYYELEYKMKAKDFSDEENNRKFKDLYTKIDIIGTEIYEVYVKLSEKAQKRF